MLLHWLWLAHRPGVSDHMKQELLRHFQDPEDVYYAEPEAFAHVPDLSAQAVEALKDKDLSAAEKHLFDAERHRLHILTCRDASYPQRLKAIFDPPAVLYYKGRLPELDALPTIAVVGTRRASAYGLTAAKRLGYQIARCGGVVVSGMAWGIDSMAMSGCLTAGQPVVGVLGCGADIVYPPSNGSLFRDTEGYGCILSEFPPGTPPARWTFPKRNRLISGLSCGVLVVEAPEKSGSLITARLALEQGRDVFVVPGNIDQPGFVGSNRLLRDGAIAASSGWDILSEYTALFPDKIHPDGSGGDLSVHPDEVRRAAKEAEKPLPKAAQKPRVPAKEPGLKKELDKKAIDKEASGPYSDVKTPPPSLSQDEQAIVAALKDGERLVDDVIAQTGLTTGKLLSCLTMLELKGLVRRLPGKRISLTK